MRANSNSGTVLAIPERLATLLALKRELKVTQDHLCILFYFSFFFIHFIFMDFYTPKTLPGRWGHMVFSAGGGAVFEVTSLVSLEFCCDVVASGMVGGPTDALCAGAVSLPRLILAQSRYSRPARRGTAPVVLSDSVTTTSVQPMARPARPRVYVTAILATFLSSILISRVRT